MINKIIKSLVVLTTIFTLTGCTSKKETHQEEKDECIVVNTGSENKVEDLFDFISKEQVAVTDLANSNTPEGVYTIGKIDDECYVVWKSDDDGYGYDDQKFAFLLKKTSKTEVMYIAKQISINNGISLDQFNKEYSK